MIAWSQSITFFVIRPPANLNWNNPSSIAWSAVRASLNSSFHPIGHITANVECVTPQGEDVSFWTGMTSSTNNPTDMELLREKKLGFGIFYYDFKGHLETKEEIIEDLEKARHEIGRFFSLRFLINPEHCLRMRDYYQQFQNKGVDAFYGLNHRPRYKEGAGCTAYAMSFLDVAGVFSQSLQNAWGKTILIPEELIGSESKPVPMLDLLYSTHASRWAQEDEDHRRLAFFDTQFMAEWATQFKGASRLPAGISHDQAAYERWHKIVRIRERIPGRSDGRLVNRSNQFFGLTIDARHYKAAQDPIWKH
jgi:hypothetical protein